MARYYCSGFDLFCIENDGKMWLTDSDIKLVNLPAELSSAA